MRNRLPFWLRQEIPGYEVSLLADLLAEYELHTVCQEAHCPNISFCFKNRKLTFMILGNACSRRCGFCAVGNSQGASFSYDTHEPYRISQLVGDLALRYVVITSVTRDDLEDGGAEIFARTTELIHALGRDIKVELLIPDFNGNPESIRRILQAQPLVIAHNLETVRSIFKRIRPQADYDRSLGVLNKTKQLSSDIITKSGLMLGLGESEEEVISSMKELQLNNCDILTLGQYLAPSQGHYPVYEFIAPSRFEKYKKIGEGLGFKKVISAPLVRSSYLAEIVFEESQCTI